MKKGGKGGGRTKTGLYFEKKTDLLELLKRIKGYSLKKMQGKAGTEVYFNNKFKKYEFYKFLEEKGIDWREKILKRLIPDDAIIVIVNETLFIIEIKYQEVGGSVDEKLQTCDFKKKQYMKLVSSLNLKVEYIYLLSEWFKKSEYKDVLEYITNVGCHYTFDVLPLDLLGLPS